MDVLTPEQRRLNMSRIRGKSTRPELLLRRELHGLGLRYRLHAKALPGSPDLVFAKRRAAVFVHGCFWHGHDCPMFRLPATRPDFWRTKIERNRERDNAALAALHEAGWRTAVIWECALLGRARRALDEVVHAAADFIRSETAHLDVAGRWP